MRASWALLPVAGFALVSSEALACGGCFGPPTSPTQVTGHRMAFAVSDAQTVLWDQFEYQGDPEDFSWVLPVLPGAYVEIADDAWLSALDAFTATIVTSPRLNCSSGIVAEDDTESGSGCCTMGDDDADDAPAGASANFGGNFEPPPVTILRQETVGPYDTVVLRSDDPDALRTWLTSNGYVIPQEIEPVIDAYVTEGKDFLALRLSPGVGVKQMQPVRVITPGGEYLLPLRMVAAGVGSLVDIKLFVIAEERYAMPDIAEVSVPLQDLTIDFGSGDNNYVELRAAALAQNRGKSYVTSFARSNAFSMGNVDPNFRRTQVYTPPGSNYSASTLAELYYHQATADAGSPGVNCPLQIELTTSSSPVVDECPEGEPCVNVPNGSLSNEDFVCDGHSDLATAFVGMHPDRTWVTRMELNLPSTALDADCVVEPAVSQSQELVFRVATKVTNAPCPVASLESPPRKRLGKPFSGPFAACAFALSFLFRRRARSKARA